MRIFRFKRIVAALISCALLFAAPGSAQFTPGPGVVVICKSGVAVYTAYQTAEQVLYTCALPPLSQANAVRVTFGASTDGVVAARTIRVRLSGLTGTVLASVTQNDTTFSYNAVQIENRGSRTSQITGLASVNNQLVNPSSLSNTASTVNTAVGTSLVVTLSKTVAITDDSLDWITVELL